MIGRLFKSFSFAMIGLFIGACSIYQSEARKFLESNAYDYAGVSAEAHVVSCASPAALTSDDLEPEAHESALIYRLSPVNIRVMVLDSTYSCDYAYEASTDADAGLEGAVEYTLKRQLTDPSPGRIDKP